VYLNGCNWKFIIEALMKMLFGSFLVCFTIIFVWNWISPWSVCFDSKMFSTGIWMSRNVKCWFGEWLSGSRVGVTPTIVPVNLYPLSGENPSYRIEHLRGSNPYNGVRLAFASERKKSHIGVSWMAVEEPVLPSPSGKNPISGRTNQILEVIGCTHKHTMRH